MGFRFRKSIKIAPGIRLNLSKSGVSTSIGGRGATINLGKRGVRGTVGLPGTGLSYSDMLVNRSSSQSGIGSNGPTYSSSGRRILIFLAIGAGTLLLVVLLGRGSKTVEQARPVERATSAPIEEAPQTSGATTSVTMATVNCRSGPSKRATVVKPITADTAVSVVATEGKWSKINSGSAECWVSSDYIG